MITLVNLVNMLNLLITFSSFVVGLVFFAGHLDTQCDAVKKDYAILVVAMINACGIVFSMLPLMCCFKPFSLEFEWNAYCLYKTSTWQCVILFVAWTVFACLRQYKCSDEIYWYLQATILISAFMQALGFYAFMKAVMQGLKMELLERYLKEQN